MPISRIPRAFRRLMGMPPWPAGGIVLLYHRVAALADDPQRLAVSPDRFADHLRVIARHGVPMSLETMVELAREAALPPGAVAVTFDDGYADTLHCAAPLLQAARIPATVFVATATLGGDREFWWDELERLVLAPGAMPARLRLQIGDESVDWDLADTAVAGDGRRRAYAGLCHRLRSVAGRIRDRSLDDLSAFLGQARGVRSSHRPLLPHEVTALAGVDGITIGSHSESHPSLACLSPDEQRREIAGARRRLEPLTGLPVTTLAYPFGGSPDVSDRTVAIAQEEGMTVACCSEPDSVRCGTNPHRVPRLIARNWTKAEFEQYWGAWMAVS